MAFSRLLVHLAGQSRVIPHRHLTRSVLRVDRFFPCREGLCRTVATIPSKPPHSGDGDRSSRGKKFLAALSSALVGAGLVVGYKLFNDGLRLEWNKAECANSSDPCDECGESCIHKLDKEEENIAKANSDLEKALKDIKPKAQQAAEDAMKAYCDATDIVKKFMDRAYCAIENDGLESPEFEEIWCEVYTLAKERCEAVKDAMTKGQLAWTLLCRLRDTIDSARCCKYTECNPLLITAEEMLLCAERELINAKNRLDCIQSESRLVEQYQNLVQDFRKDLKAELESLFSSDDCISTFTENESAMILTHAYKKVLRIQKELAQVQTNDVRVQDDSQLNSIGQETIPESEKNIRQGPTEADIALLEATFVQKLEEVRKFYDSELTKALIRQAQVLQEVFERAKTAIQDEYERRLKHRDDLAEAESLVELRDKYNRASAALAAMEVALKDRHVDDGKAEKYKKLWAVSNSLYNRINFAGHVSEDVQNDTVCVNKNSLLKEFADDEFVTSLLKNIPDTVSSAESLRERFFNKVDKGCRNVAVFKDDDSLSLWKYLLGTLQASLTIKCEGEHEDDGTVYSVLDRTGYFLKHGDLLEAAAVLNKIEGAIPRRICQDWLNDARSHLETKQTLFALMTYASANNFR